MISDGFVSLDREWRYVYVNAAAERVTGKRRDQLLGHSIWELYPEAIGTTFEGEARRCVAEQVTMELEEFHEAAGTWYALRLFPSSGGLSILFQDVTQRKHAEQELRRLLEVANRQTAKLDAVIEAIPDAVYIGSADGISRCNQAALNLLGAASIEDLNAQIPELTRKFAARSLDGKPFAPEDLPFSRALRGEVVLGSESIVRQLDSGQDRYIRNAAAPVRMDGKIIGAVTIDTDITLMHQTRDALQRSEERFRTLVAGRAPIVWTTNAKGEAHEQFTGWSAFTGQSADQIQGHGWIDAIHPEDQERARLAWRDALAARSPFQMEFRLRRHDGAYRDIVDQGVPILGPDGDIREWVGTCTDVTERKRIAGALRASEQFNRVILDALPAHIAVLDKESNIIGVNQQWLKFAAENGHPDPHKIAVGANYIAACRAAASRGNQDAKAAIAAIQAALDDAAPSILEYACHSPTTLRWFLMHVVPLPAEVGGAVVTHLDISARKLAEAHMIKAHHEAVAASKAKDEFLAMLSHELRTPISAMLIWANLLQGNSLDESQKQDALDTIIQSAKEQSRLVNDLLDASRILYGKVRPELHPLNLRDVVAEAVIAIRPMAASKPLQLTTDLHDCPVLGDGPLLRQVVANLLSNALKFTPAGGSILVRLETQSHPSPPQAVLEVIDTGEGIAAEFLPFLFDRFRQADSSSTRKHGGLGLGLSIVRQLVELHGGSARAHSAGVGCGAHLIVTLPIDAAQLPSNGSASPVEPGEPSDLPSLQDLRILLVDDDIRTRKSLATLLQAHGAIVEMAHSVHEAWSLLCRCQPDVLLSDIAMPGHDGYELIQKLRAAPEQAIRQIATIALTAYASAEDRARALAAGFDLYLAKPVGPTDLIRAVAQVAHQRKAEHFLL